MISSCPRVKKTQMENIPFYLFKRGSKRNQNVVISARNKDSPTKPDFSSLPFYLEGLHSKIILLYHKEE